MDLAWFLRGAYISAIAQKRIAWTVPHHAMRREIIIGSLLTSARGLHSSIRV